jgi:aminoglycoside phosphotransferase (APT) family kinase protein
VSRGVVDQEAGIPMGNNSPHAAAIASTLGLPTVDVVPVVAGASNLAYEVLDPANPTDGAVAFLRVQGHGALAGSAFDLHREAELLDAASKLGFCVADVIATFSEPTALLMEVVPGTSRPDPSDLDAVAAEYMGLVAQLHAADVAEFPVEQFATVRAAIEADLEFWDDLARAGGVDTVPLLAVARRVLGATMPDDDSLPVLVHGDIGPGNFMIDEGHVTAMLDWEMAHVGDPHEDLAWMWMRGAHTDFGDPMVRIAEYASASGRWIDHDRVRWHLASVMWKSCISMEKEVRTNGPSQATVIHAVVLLTYEALLGAELMALMGRPYELLSQEPIETIGPAVRAAERLLDIDEIPREAAIIAEYLRDSVAHAEWEHRALYDDARQLLGLDAEDLAGHVAAAADDGLGPLVEVVARAADRAALATAKAVRLIERARRIGLGAPPEPTQGE